MMAWMVMVAVVAANAKDDKVTLTAGDGKAIVKSEKTATLEFDYSNTIAEGKPLKEHLQTRGENFVKDWPELAKSARERFIERFNSKNKKGVQIVEGDKADLKMKITIEKLDFGKTTGERFIDLVKALDEVEGISRYRISSLEPDLLSDELIAYCAESRAFMPHFHIPLQSGSDTVLKLMHRHYDAQLFADKICKIKALMPDAFIGVDVMVGCRGETPECFEETYEFLDRLDVTQLHVFPYSERPGTSALSIPYTVSDQDKKLRSKRLLDLSDRKTEAFYTQHIGQEAEVLFEKAPRGKAMHGFTKNYIRVELPAKVAKPELDNQLVMVRLGELTADKQALRVECL